MDNEDTDRPDGLSDGYSCYFCGREEAECECDG